MRPTVGDSGIFQNHEGLNKDTPETLRTLHHYGIE